MISMVLMEKLKLGGIFSVEMLPLDKRNYCAIAQEPVTTAPEMAHTIPVTTIPKGQAGSGAPKGTKVTSDMGSLFYKI